MLLQDNNYKSHLKQPRHCPWELLQNIAAGSKWLEKPWRQQPMSVNHEPQHIVYGFEVRKIPVRDAINRTYSERQILRNTTVVTQVSASTALKPLD